MPTTGTVSYAYNAASERTSLTYPSTHQVTYAYTNRGQLDTVTDWQSGVTDYGYDNAGRLTGISYPNGVTGTLGYDNADRLTSISYDDSGTNLESIAYTLNAVGIRTQMVDSAGTTTWGYDALYRLTSAGYPNGDAISYGYDAVGNRTSLTVNGNTTTNTFDNADRMTASGSDTYSYNNNGNLTSKTVGGVTTSYAYDALNRLTSISSGGSTIGSYTYNGDGLRVAKTVGGVTTNFTWDPAGIGTALSDGTSEYVWGAGLISRDAGASAAYAHQDGLGSTRLVTNNSGAVTGTTQYDAFGASRSTTGTQLRFGFTGEQVDAESGLVYLRARYLDPASGRFLTKDPYPGRLAKPGTMQDYSYVGNNPVLVTDPSGLTWEENIERFWNWVTEQGDDVEYLGPGDPAFEEMMETAGVEQMRQEYATGGLQSGMGGYSTLDAFIQTILHPLNGTQFQVGGYLYRYTNNCDGTVTYEITNVLSADSFFYHYLPIPHYSRDSWFPLMGDQVQIFRWTEPNPFIGSQEFGGGGGGGERGYR